MTRRALLPLLAASLLVGAGCQPSGPLVGGSPLAVRDAKVVSLSPSTTEIITKTGLNNQLIGRSANCNWPLNLASVSVVMTGTAPDYEKIVGLKPNLVVYDEALFSQAEIQKIKDLGIETLGWNPNSLKEYENQAWQIVNVMGGVMMTSEYIDGIHRYIQSGEAGLEEKGLSDVRVAVVVGRDNYLLAGTESLWADLLAQMGAKVIGPKGTSYAPMNVEAIIQGNPEVIFAAGTGEQILKDPRLRTVKAVAGRQVYNIDADVLLRRGGRLDQLTEAFSVGLNKVDR